jgi:polyhydroxybutyrate depolymerase
MRRLSCVLVVLGVACGDPVPEGTGPGSTGSATGDAPSTGEAPSTGGPSGGSETGEPDPTGGATGSDSAATSSTGAPTTGEPDPTTGEPDTTTGAAACTPGALGPGEHTIDLMHDGIMRSALVHVPASVDLAAATPLVLNFHGFTSNADQQVFFSGMNPTADAEGFIVAYPQGIDSSWNAGDCCGNAVTQNIDDVGFARALVARLQTELCIDERRIFATGMSNGGFMSHRLACEASDVFAAIAPVSAAMGMPNCQPGRPVPVLMFNGTLDPLVNYDGNGGFKGALETFAEWADHDACTGEPVPGKTAGQAACQTHATCAADVTVTLCTFEGMGHCWPGNAFCPFGAASTDLAANAEMWEFFMQYPLP